MLQQWKNELAEYRKKYPGFFVFTCIVLFFYGIQFAIKTEITPLGYFSLYSNRALPQTSYSQILPYDTVKKAPVNIYDLKGTQFLMMEILPTRYDILANSDHCNQMNHRLRRIGLGDNNASDCQELQRFREWFPRYAARLGVDLTHAPVKSISFNAGKIVDINNVKYSAIYR